MNLARPLRVEDVIRSHIRGETEMKTAGQEKSKALQMALDVVDAIGEAGLVTVPAKPTAAMLASGARAGDVSVECAWRIYQAMIKAND
jgi:hypothetical protein